MTLKRARKAASVVIGLCIGALLLFVMVTRINPLSPGQRMDWAAYAGENYDRAAFRVWFPDGVASVRGVIVLVPGSNEDGRSQIEDRQWQALAMRQNLALIGCYLSDKPHPNMGVEAYANVSHGSGEALLNALNDAGKQLSHPELASAPLLLWGMSAGGEFNYEFVAWKPDRVAGFIVNKGGVYYSTLLAPEARRVPGLFFVGGKDLQTRQDVIRRLFQMNREAGSNWALIEEPTMAHEIGKSREMAQTFFESLMAPPLRLR
jgi:dienelactone hydrolase